MTPHQQRQSGRRRIEQQRAERQLAEDRAAADVLSGKVRERLIAESDAAGIALAAAEQRLARASRGDMTFMASAAVDSAKARLRRAETALDDYEYGDDDGPARLIPAAPAHRPRKAHC